MCVCLSVCMFVTKVVIVDYGPIEWVYMVLRILNLEAHQNSMIVSKVTTILTMFFIHDKLWLIWIWNQSTVVNRGVSRESCVVVAWR